MRTTSTPSHRATRWAVEGSSAWCSGISPAATSKSRSSTKMRRRAAGRCAGIAVNRPSMAWSRMISSAEAALGMWGLLLRLYCGFLLLLQPLGDPGAHEGLIGEVAARCYLFDCGNHVFVNVQREENHALPLGTLARARPLTARSAPQV